MPDLAQLTDAPEAYYARHSRALADGDFQARAMACWGLIARGSESLPYLAQMLTSSSSDAREDAAGAYAWLARTDRVVVDALVTAIRSEADVVVRDSMATALGQLKDKRALPILAQLLRDAATDGDSRSLITAAIGRIARRRFE